MSSTACSNSTRRQGREFRIGTGEIRYTRDKPALLQQLSKDARRAAMFRSRMEAVDKWMSDRGLDKKMRYSISKYYAEVRARHVACICCC